MPNIVTYKVALEVASHEAVIRKAYKDSVKVWTWSVGLTAATGHNVERYIDKPASLQKCMNVYVWALKNYAKQVNQAFKGTRLSEAQFAAALSFHWNTGKIKKASWVKHFKAGNMAKAKKGFMLYKIPPEVKGRREKECALFFDGVWSNDGRMTEYVRLTSRYSPVWKSARRIDVTKELGLAFFEANIVRSDHKPRPSAKVTQPTISPPGPEPKQVVVHPIPPIPPTPPTPSNPSKKANLWGMSKRLLGMFSKWRK